MDKVLLITNIPTPYRRPIFETIGHHVDLTVLFTHKQKKDRYWDESPNDTSISAKVIPSIKFGPVIINYTLLTELIVGSYDVVIVGDNASNILSTILVGIYCRIFDSELIVWTEGIDTEYNNRGIRGYIRGFLDTFRKLVYAQAEVCLGYSMWDSQEYLKKRGVPQDQIVVGRQIYPRSELPQCPPPSERSENTVLYLGQLIERKGVDLLIEAAKQWDTTRTLMIAGDGPKRKSLEKLAKGYSNIDFLGFVSENEKARLLTTADVVVLPTRHDTWGLVVNEALNYGTPVVVTNRAGSAGLIADTEAGIVVDPTVEALNEGIGEVFRNLERYSSNANSNAQLATDPRVGADSFIKAINLVNKSNQ